VLVWEGVTLEAENDTATNAAVRPPPRALTNVTVILPAQTRSVSVMGAGAVGATSLICAVRTSLECADPTQQALADWEAARALSPQALFAEHTAEWATVWQAGFEVAGRPDVAAAVNASLYYLLSSVRPDTTHSLSPGGLASNGYNGHTFWDCAPLYSAAIVVLLLLLLLLLLLPADGSRLRSQVRLGCIRAYCCGTLTSHSRSCNTEPTVSPKPSRRHSCEPSPQRAQHAAETRAL
jgi:hypothetical protein